MILKFRWKLNHDFTNQDCLHCAIVKVLYDFKVTRAHEARNRPFFFQNIQNGIFKVFKTFKNNTTFTRAACWNNSKISNGDNSTTLMMLFCCQYCWLLCCNYWRSLMLWNSTSSCHLKLTVPVKLALHPFDSFFICNCYTFANSVDKHCSVVFKIQLQVNIDSKRFIDF